MEVDLCITQKKIVGNYKERLKWGFSNVQLIKILALEKCITAFPIQHQKEYYNTIKCTVFWWGDHDYSNSLNLITIYWRQCVFPGWSLRENYVFGSKAIVVYTVLIFYTCPEVWGNWKTGS